MESYTISNHSCSLPLKIYPTSFEFLMLKKVAYHGGEKEKEIQLSFNSKISIYLSLYFFLHVNDFQMI